MPVANLSWGNVHYRLSGPARATPVLYLHSLLSDGSMWSPVVSQMGAGYFAVRMDLRGHGASDAPAGPCNLSALAADAVQLLDELGLARAHIVGAAFGGMVAQQLVIDHPRRAFTLATSNSAAVLADAQVWNTRQEQARHSGVASLVEPTLKRWFTESFLLTRAERLLEVEEVMRRTSLNGYLASVEAIKHLDQSTSLKHCRIPALVIGATLDQAMPVERARFLHQLLDGSTYTEIATGSHMVALEQPEVYADRLRQHIERNRTQDEIN